MPEEELARAMVMVMTDMNFLVISRGVKQRLHNP
jgi:hypothetical protein